MDDAELQTRMGRIAELPLDERADPLEALIDELESALEETSGADADSGSRS